MKTIRYMIFVMLVALNSILALQAADKGQSLKYVRKIKKLIDGFKEPDDALMNAQLIIKAGPEAINHPMPKWRSSKCDLYVGEDLVSLLFVAAYFENASLIRQLIAAKANVHIKSPSGRTIVHSVACWADKKLLQHILCANIDPMIKDRYEVAPIDLAVGCDNKEVIQYFKEIKYSCKKDVIILSRTNYFKSQLFLRAEVDENKELYQEIFLAMVPSGHDDPIIQKTLKAFVCDRVMLCIKNQRFSILEVLIENSYFVFHPEYYELAMQLGCDKQLICLKLLSNN